MSGRSAYVRAKKTELAEKKTGHRSRHDIREQDEDDIVSALSVLPPIAPIPSTYHSNVSPTPHSTYGPFRRHSVSSTTSCHHHHHHHPRRPRVPVIETSAIEKSDFRTHLDGMSASLRGKLGRFLNARTEDTSLGDLQRPGTAYGSSSSGSRTQSFGFPPSTAQSVSSGKSPANEIGLGFTSGGGAPQPQQQKALVSRVRKFEPGMAIGRAPEQGYQAIRDTEMWFDDGDVLVYLITNGGKTKPAPSMRLHSQMIEDSGSKEFIKQLRSGHVPAEFPQFLPSHAASSSRVTTPDETMLSFELAKHSQGMRHDTDNQTNHVRPLRVNKKYVRGPKGVQYELYIPWPGQDSGTDQLLWHLTTRNFFAILLKRNSLWGQTFYSSLFLVYERIVKFPHYLPRDIDRGQWITDYISRKRFDDVRNNPSYAAGLLAFSEIPGVRWKEGYTEGFVHCSGMLRVGLQNIPEFRNISAISSIYIETANKEMLKRVHRAQIWLTDFDFSEMWPITSAPAPAAKGSFDRFSKCLRKFYENEFGRWPPTHENTWLTREIIQRLNADFHTVYDFFVDRDIIFEASNVRADSRPVTMTSKSGSFFRADTSDLPITDILVGFDNRQHFPHIPHPYPVTPPSVPAHTTSGSTKSSFFGPRSKKPMTAAENYDLARTKSLSYTVASNLYTLRDRYTGVPDGIVKKILDFEEVDGVRQLDPFDARRGHWILIYGVLQILATVGVDTPGLRFKEGIEYHLSPPMTGIVPWAAEGWPAEPEATHELSYCWTVPATWGPPSSGRTLGTDPRINLTIGRQHMNSPSGEITKEDRPNGDKTKRNEGKGKASVGDRTYGHRSSSSLTITGNGVGSSRQAVAWKPVAIASSADGKTWIEEDDGIEGEAGPSTAPEPVDKRRRAEEWVASDASGVGFGGDGAADLNEASFQDGSSIGNSYNLREAYENRNGGHETLIVGVGVADGNPPNGRLSLAARRRRAQIHGFSTFEAPQGW